jgi:hypothetical protein
MPSATEQQNVGFLRCIMQLRWALQDAQRAAVIVGQGAEQLREIAPAVEQLEKLAKTLPMPACPRRSTRQQPAQRYHGD